MIVLRLWLSRQTPFWGSPVITVWGSWIAIADRKGSRNQGALNAKFWDALVVTNDRANACKHALVPTGLKTCLPAIQRVVMHDCVFQCLFVQATCRCFCWFQQLDRTMPSSISYAAPSLHFNQCQREANQDKPWLIVDVICGRLRASSWHIARTILWSDVGNNRM